MVPELNKLTPDRYQTLDAWRGLASLWVVMLHATQTTIPEQFPQLAHRALYAFSFWGSLGVPIFFVVSGYCICGSACGLIAQPRETLQKELNVTVPPSVQLEVVEETAQKLCLVLPAAQGELSDLELEAVAGGKDSPLTTTVNKPPELPRP